MKKKIFCLLMCVAMVVTLMPSMAFAESTTKNGSIAKVTWDEGNNEQYDTGNITLQVGPGSELQYCLVGTGTNASFEPMSDVPESWSISVKKVGWTEAVTKDNPTEEDPLYEGAFWGWYDIDEKAPQLGYNQNAILLGADAYGDYQITMNWVIDGVTYTASTTLTLEKKAQLAKGRFWSLDNTDYESKQDFLKHWSTQSTMTTDENNKFQIDYEPYYSYRETYTMLYTDGENGILNFEESNCDIEGLFTAGDAVEYKSDLSIVPLVVDYSKITADMVGESYILTFKTASVEKKCDVIIAKKSELSNMKDGQVYAISSGVVKDDGKLYIDNQDEDLDSLVKAQFSDKIKRTTEMSSTHFGVWNASEETFTPVEISCSNSAITISGSKDEGYEFYADSVTSGGFTAGEKTIPYSFYLPESGFYRNAARNPANYLSDEVYLAEETAADGKYTFYYLVKAASLPDKGDLTVTYKENLNGVSVEGADDWTDSTNNQTYYAWRIVVDSSFSSNDGGSFWFNVKGEKDGTYHWYDDSIEIHDAEEVPESQQLYWFYRGNAHVDENGYLQVGEDEQVDDYAWSQDSSTQKNGSNSGYFAVKDNSGYKAVNSVQVKETEGVSITDPSTDDQYLYKIEWTKLGEYHFVTTIDEKKYRFNLNVKLPGTGFYLTSTRSEDAYLENEFHYINATEKNEEGTEAYFYLIAPTNDYSVDQISLSFGAWKSEEEIDDNEWMEENPEGLDIGSAIEATFEGEKYFVWKITVSERYRNINSEYKNIRLTYGTDFDRTLWIRIYDSAEIVDSKQLYAFDCDEVEIGNDQKLQLKDGQGYTLDDIASECFNFSEKKGTITRCFAVRENGNYYAVDSLTASGEGISVAKSKDYEHGYTIEWSDFGEYRLVGTYKENEYYFDLAVELPNTGFYCSANRNEDGYLDGEFYYANATDRSEDGTKAYFYLIARIYDYNAEKIQISIGEWNYDEGEGKSIWSDEQIEGLSIGAPESKTFDAKKYIVCKVTVDETYRSTDYYRNFRIHYEDTDYSWSRTEGIRIYDSTEIPESKQLYAFWTSKVEVGENQELQLKEGQEGTIKNASVNHLYGTVGDEYRCYFAVEKDGNYYVVSNLQASSDGACLSESKDNKYYAVKAAKSGEHRLIGTYDGNEYYLDLTAELPSTGFYSTSERSDESYLTDNKFHYIYATEKNETETYFYLIASTNGCSLDKIKISIGESNWDAEEQKSIWSEKQIEGISIGNPEIKTFDGEEYVVCRVKIDKNHKCDGEYRHFRIEYEDNEQSWYSEESIRIYDSTEIAESKQMYAFWYSTVEVDENKKLQLKEGQEGTIEDASMKYLGKTVGNESQYYFAVKADSDYYVVNSLQASSDGVCLSESEDNKYYVVKAVKSGEHRLIGTYNGNEYYLDLTAKLPSTGFYSTSERNDESYLADSEFHYKEATDRSDDGTEAYFYLIAPTNGCSLDKIQVSIGEWNYDEEESIRIWSEKQIEGFSLGTPEIKTFDGVEYVVCRVKIDKNHKCDGEYRLFRIQYENDNEYSWYNEDVIHVYDSTEIPEEEQLYMFYLNSVELDDNGKLKPVTEGESMQNLADKKLYTGGRWSGYFAVKSGTDYYVVESISTPDGIEATKESEGIYDIVITKYGEFEISAVYQGKTYRMRDSVAVPLVGFFAKKERTAENYLYDYFSVKDAAEKSEDGKESYFYLRWRYDTEPSDEESIQLKSSERETGDTTGLKLEYQDKVKEKGQTYYIYRITVPSTYYALDGYIERWYVEDESRLKEFRINTLRFGDVDANGKIDIVDAIYLRRYVAGWDGYTLTDSSVAYLNSDSVIDIADVMVLEKYIARYKGYEMLPVA